MLWNRAVNSLQRGVPERNCQKAALKISLAVHLSCQVAQAPPMEQLMGQ
jgi:hypothetical protein